MDPNNDQNNQNPTDVPGGGTTGDQPATDAPDASASVGSMPAQPTPAGEKCSACGGEASNGNCAACSQSQFSCTCPPAAPDGGQNTPPQPIGGSEPVAGTPV